jgi:crossover junction endodeoxyribonuclease RuvC
VIGIDPGVEGAVAVVDDAGRLVALDDTPVVWTASRGRRRRSYDLGRMRALLARWMGDGAPVHAVVELQQAMPGQGVSSMFSTGYGYGLWIGLLAGLGIPHTPVPARVWQRALLASGSGDTKGRALVAASRLFPLCPIPQARHGRADALLLAEYGRRMLAGRQVAS